MKNADASRSQNGAGKADSAVTVTAGKPGVRGAGWDRYAAVLMIARLGTGQTGSACA